MNALASGAEGRIVAHSASASHATEGESWIERKPRPYRSLRLLQRAEQRKRGSKLEMRG